MTRIVLKSIGSYVPERVLSNADLEKMVDTTDQWILERTGIRERRLAGDREFTHHMAVEATRVCMEGREERPQMIISSTCTPGRLCPNQASFIAHELKYDPSAVLDVNAACPGWVYALTVAKSLMETQPEYQDVLVTASEKMSQYTDYTDRNSCVLFGDGASAVLLSREGEGPTLEYTELGADTSGALYVNLAAHDGNMMFDQDGKRVYRFAVTIMHKMLDRLIEKAGLGPDDPYHVVFHQANLRMLQSVADTRKLPMERVHTTIEDYGNTSSASVGLTLDRCWREGRFQKGDVVFLITFGGGLTWAGAILRW